MKCMIEKQERTTSTMKVFVILILRSSDEEMSRCSSRGPGSISVSPGLL